jgi:hypothetical protein
MAIPKGRQAIQRPAEGYLAARIEVQELQLAPAQTTAQIEQPIEIAGLAALRQLLLAPAQDLLAWVQLTKGRIAAALLGHGEILKGTPAETRLRPQLPSQFQLKQA